MSDLTRRQFVTHTAAAAAAVGIGVPSVHAQKRGGTMRFIPHADLKVLDPIWTTAYITRNHSYMIYDTLFGTDEKLQIKPQMVDRWNSADKGMKWSFTLRDGLKWHDGQPVVAEDAVESVKRWTKRDPLGKLLAAHTAKLAPVDKKTFTLELAQPFGPVLDALGKPSSNVPFVMPARIAATPDSEQIKEFVGSGPFRFVKDEWQPGNQVVYVRNPDYVPRSDVPSGSTGGKKVNLDKVVWRYIPDAATAAAALDAGEVDWWENPPLDFVPRIEKNASLATFVTDPRGTQGWVRPNHLRRPVGIRGGRTRQAGPRPSPPAPQGIGLRRSARGRPRSERHRADPRRGPGNARADDPGRLQRRSAVDGLVDRGRPARQEGASGPGRLEPALHVVDRLRRHQPRRPRRDLRRRRQRLVRLARERRDREAQDRLGARHRSRPAEADRRGDPEDRLRRGHVRALRPVGAADGVSQERPGHPAVPGTGVLERVDRLIAGHDAGGSPAPPDGHHPRDGGGGHRGLRTPARHARRSRRDHRR